MDFLLLIMDPFPHTFLPCHDHGGVIAGPSGLTISRDKCHYDGSQKLVEDACLGKSECTVENDHKKLGIEDPCPSIGWDRRLVATATCA